MLVTTHAFIGAAAGTKIGNPTLAFFVGIILHIIADKIPHFWPTSKKYQNFVMYADGISAILVLLYIFFSNFSNKIPMIFGALGGISVDFAFVLVAIVIFPSLRKLKIVKWHELRQYHKAKLLFYLTDFVLILLSALFIWRFK